MNVWILTVPGGTLLFSELRATIEIYISNEMRVSRRRCVFYFSRGEFALLAEGASDLAKIDILVVRI